ncbi:MAG: hypothetical protein WA715_18590 [Candidatus Acidiferrum sp.]|jgi:hypothetical protein
MACLSCKSNNQTELSAELIIHFRGIKKIDNPGVFVFPKLLVCLDCGFSQLKVPAPELASVVAGISEMGHVVGRMFDDKFSLRIELNEKRNDG